jgi:hypothetical protein
VTDTEELLYRYHPTPEPKRYLVTRHVMDPREGELGHITLTITAWTGPDAKVLADNRVAEINQTFQRQIQERGLSKWWNDGGWEKPEEVLRRLQKPRR